MDISRSLQRIRSFTWILSKLYAVMLLALPVPMCCLLISGRSDEQVCRLYFAGMILFLFAAAGDLAARKLQTFSAYLISCILAGAAVFGLVFSVGNVWLNPGLRTALLLETACGILFLALSSAQVRMREKRRRKAMQENDITWTETPVLLERPSFFGMLFFTAAYLLAKFTHCPAFCDLSLKTGICAAVLLLLYHDLQEVLAYFQEFRHLTHVPAAKILRQHLAVLTFLVCLLGAAAIPALLTGRYRSYADIREWKSTQVIAPEEQLFPEMGNSLPEIIPHSYIEKGEYRPTPGWYKPAGYLLAGLALLFFASLILKGIRDYARSFRGNVEENGDLVFSLDTDEAAGIRPAAGKKGGGRALSEREKIRRNYRKTIRKYRRRGQLPLGVETPSQIEEETPFPDGFDVASLHETYITARYSGEDA